MTILDRITNVVKESGAITLQEIYTELPDINKDVIRGVINRYVKKPNSNFKRCSRGVYVAKCEEPTNIISLAQSTPMKKKSILHTFKEFFASKVGTKPVFEVRLAAGAEHQQLSFDFFSTSQSNVTTIEMMNTNLSTNTIAKQPIKKDNSLNNKALTLLDSPYHSIPIHCEISEDGKPIEYFDNKIFGEDSRDFLKKLPDNSYDLVITDPPYRITSRGNSGTSGGMLKDKQSMKGKIFKHNDIKTKDYIPELFRVLKEGTHCYIMTNHVNLVEMLTTSIESGFHFIKSLVWNKGNKIMGTAYMSQFEYILFFRKGKFKKINECGTSDILNVPNKKLKENGKNLHDTEKPVELMKTLIKNSTEAGQRVLDPFFGIGAVGIACKELGRIYTGNELDSTYREISLKRTNAASLSLI